MATKKATFMNLLATNMKKPGDSKKELAKDKKLGIKPNKNEKLEKTMPMKMKKGC